MKNYNELLEIVRDIAPGLKASQELAIVGIIIDERQDAIIDCIERWYKNEADNIK